MTDEQLQATDEQQEGEWTAEDRVKRAIVLQVLRDDHLERWTRAELERELPDVLPEEIASAVEDLKAEGVLSFNRKEEVWASLCARTLDALGLIAI
jgi:hypothetical protein